MKTKIISMFLAIILLLSSFSCKSKADDGEPFDNSMFQGDFSEKTTLEEVLDIVENADSIDYLNWNSLRIYGTAISENDTFYSKYTEDIKLKNDILLFELLTDSNIDSLRYRNTKASLDKEWLICDSEYKYVDNEEMQTLKGKTPFSFSLRDFLFEKLSGDQVFYFFELSKFMEQFTDEDEFYICDEGKGSVKIKIVYGDSLLEKFDEIFPSFDSAAVYFSFEKNSLNGILYNFKENNAEYTANFMISITKYNGEISMLNEKNYDLSDYYTLKNAIK